MTTPRELLITVQMCLLVLTCNSAQQKLKSLNDLKKLDFGQTVPKHSLLLLHWFANVIDVDNNDILLLTFDPNTEDFGSHHYGNFEDMLDPLPQGFRYYTVGNLHEQTSNELPEYVLHPPVREYEGSNMDRIIFRVQERSSRPYRIDRVYLTQHYRQNEHQGTRYNPENTYHISARLLQEIRLFSVEGNHRTLEELRDLFESEAEDSQLWNIANIWGHSWAFLGLMLFIVKEKKKHKRPTANTHPSQTRRHTQAHAHVVVDMPDEWNNLLRYNQLHTNVVDGESDEWYNSQLRHNQLPIIEDQVYLNLVTGKNGNATIVWRNISTHRLKEGVAVVLFKSEIDTEVSSTYKLIQESEGSFMTSVPLNDGLQVRLHKARRWCFFWTKVEEEICRGKAFKSQDLVSIPGFDAYLQLFVKDGKACVRLFVNMSFMQWRSEFKNSWVGFYDSVAADTKDYSWWQWQWVTKFKQGQVIGGYKTYEYHSNRAIAPGVQARFILNNYRETARTPTWCS